MLTYICTMYMHLHLMIFLYLMCGLKQQQRKKCWIIYWENRIHICNRVNNIRNNTGICWLRSSSHRLLRLKTYTASNQNCARTASFLTPWHKLRFLRQLTAFTVFDRFNFFFIWTKLIKALIWVMSYYIFSWLLSSLPRNLKFPPFTILIVRYKCAL